MIPGEDQLIENRQAEYIEHLKERVERLTTGGAETKELVDKLIRNARIGADMSDYIVRAVDVHELQVRVSEGSNDG